MRLIDADVLLKKVKEAINQYTKHRDILRLCADVKDAVIKAPTIEAEPVMHGRWEKDPDMRRMNGHIYDYRCSRCHCSAEKGCYGDFDRFTNYCPNCGAKMDGGADA